MLLCFEITWKAVLENPLQLTSKHINLDLTAQFWQEGLDVVVKTGRMSLLLRDALRRPLVELELGAVMAAMRRSTSEVTQMYCELHTSAWSFNPNIAAWEPVLESWDFIVNVDINKSAQVRL